MEQPERLRIALVAPPWYSVPPLGYGGIELVVYLLAEELGRMGHKVLLYASDGSRLEHAEVVALAPAGWARQLGGQDHRYREATYLARIYDHLSGIEVDLIHDHNEATGILMAAAVAPEIPSVATVHGPITEPTATFLREMRRDVDLVAISHSQRSQVEELNWVGVVHNAVDVDSLTVSSEKDDYLLQIARVCPEKGQHVTVEAARRAGRPLVLAGKIEESRQSMAYFREHIEPWLGRGVEWKENVQGEEKAELLARAYAAVFPLQWAEPFGLAMVEAMASGTPVIAFARGAAPELVEPGLTGLLVQGTDGVVEAMKHVPEIDPVACAERARARFSPRAMAEGYVRVYRAALGSRAGAFDSMTIRLGTGIKIGGEPMASVEKTIDVNAPLSIAYSQWTQFESFPMFMEGVEEVRQMDDSHLHWRALIAGKEEEWDAEITEQVPDQVIAWRSIGGLQNDGMVRFEPLGPDSCRIHLRIDYDPRGLVETIGDKLGFTSGRVQGDLERFREFVEGREAPTGAYREEIHRGQATNGDFEEPSQQPERGERPLPPDRP